MTLNLGAAAHPLNEGHVSVIFSESDQRFSIEGTGKHDAGADPGFLERGFIYIKVCGFALLILSHFS